jgi:Predicted soluble lytic transglycosylase fused to an ABC-type amino acid-binding protein
MGVNRADPVSSIYGGPAIYANCGTPGRPRLAFWDRWFLTLAAYNQGPAHLKDAMAWPSASRRRRLLGQRQKRVPLLAGGEYAARAKYGACRGSEAVNFVESVRYYYYVLNGLVVLDRPEAEHLAPLLAVNAGRGGSVAPGL